MLSTKNPAAIKTTRSLHTVYKKFDVVQCVWRSVICYLCIFVCKGSETMIAVWNGITVSTRLHILLELRSVQSLHTHEVILFRCIPSRALLTSQYQLLTHNSIMFSSGIRISRNKKYVHLYYAFWWYCFALERSVVDQITSVFFLTIGFQKVPLIYDILSWQIIKTTSYTYSILLPNIKDNVIPYANWVGSRRD